MIIVNCPQGSAEWLDARAGACTASRFREARERIGSLTEQQAKYVAAIQGGMFATEAAALAGYKKAPTSETVAKALAGLDTTKPSLDAIRYAWLLALERIAGRPLDETFTTWQMRRGQDEEPNARAAYEAHTGDVVLESGIALTDDRLFGYSTDGFVGDDGMVEIKTPSAPDKIGMTWTRPDEVVGEYIDQIQGGLWITGRRRCDLIIWTPWLRNIGKSLYIRRIERDEAYIEALEADLWRFHRLSQSLEISLRSKADEAPADDAPIFGEPAAVPAASPVLSAVARVPTVMPQPAMTGTLLPDELPF